MLLDKNWLAPQIARDVLLAVVHKTEEILSYEKTTLTYTSSAAGRLRDSQRLALLLVKHQYFRKPRSRTDFVQLDATVSTKDSEKRY